MAEPGTRRADVLASLRPRVGVRRQARATFATAVPCLVAVWALSGLYQSLGPSLAAQVTGSRDLLWGGLMVFLLTGTRNAAAFRGLTPRTAMLAGCLVLLCLGIVRFPGSHAGQWCGGRAGSGGVGVRSKPVVDDEMSAADKPQQVTVVYRKPVVRPGSPEARAPGVPVPLREQYAGGIPDGGTRVRRRGNRRDPQGLPAPQDHPQAGGRRPRRPVSGQGSTSTRPA
jgi:hypothetical protein